MSRRNLLYVLFSLISCHLEPLTFFDLQMSVVWVKLVLSPADYGSLNFFFLLIHHLFQVVDEHMELILLVVNLPLEQGIDRLGGICCEW